MNDQIRLIMFDLDGTLLTNKKKITEKTYTYLKKLIHRKKLKLGIATGRNIKSVRPLLDNFDPDKIFEFLILDNGVSAISLVDDKTFLSHMISVDEIKEVLEKYKDIKNVTVAFHNKDCFYSNKMNERVKEIMKLNNDTVHYLLEDNTDYEETERIMILLDSVDDKADYPSFKNLKGFYPVNDIYEYVSSGVSKYDGLTPLLKHAGIDITQVVFFGDGENDLELLEKSRCGIAMKNANESVKTKANDITYKTNENDGVKDYLAKHENSLKNRKRIAIVNVNSFARVKPEHIEELEEKVGPVDIIKVDVDIESDELVKKIGHYDYLILGTTPTLDRNFFEKQSNINLITRHGIGFNHIDIEAAKEKGIYVCKVTGDIESDAVAEQAVALLNTLSKKMLVADEMVRTNEWKIDRDRLMGRQISNKVTGVIGLGHIGTRFAEIMKYGYKNQVLVYDPFIPEKDIEKKGFIPVSLEELLESSDFVSLHPNLNETNQKMINAKALSKMKKEALLINTARGGLIDEDDLYTALKSGRILGFGADVLTHEPVEIDNKLLTLKNTVFSPHVGVYNEICLVNMDRKVMQDIYLLEVGEEPNEIINGVKK